ncbi:MAG TPA: transposase, partial [Kofleriaceae bacterium]
MLAQLVTAKNSDAVPLERQSKILARGGARIASPTLGDWYAGAADLAQPLWKALRDDTLGRYLISRLGPEAGTIPFGWTSRATDDRSDTGRGWRRLEAPRWT